MTNLEISKMIELEMACHTRERGRFYLRKRSIAGPDLAEESEECEAVMKMTKGGGAPSPRDFAINYGMWNHGMGMNRILC